MAAFSAPGKLVCGILRHSLLLVGLGGVAAGRTGSYSEEVWKAATGKTSQELGDEWKMAHEEWFAAAPTKVTPAEEPRTTPKPR